MAWREVLLDSVSEPRVRLGDLLGNAGATVVFVDANCPTCGLYLTQLGASRADAIVVFENPLDVAVRTARRRGFAGLIASEPRPYDASRLLDVRTVPTTIRVASDGSAGDRVVGWDRGALAALTGCVFAMDAPETKPGCGARWTYDHGGQDTAVDDVEDLYERGFTDGLPVVAPTPERVEAMLAGRDAAASLGFVPPGMGEATLERVAACAVLAGCKPAYFPVVVAAVDAMLDERFNLRGQIVTTSPPGQIVVVNGPIRDAIGLNSGMGALGPGWRANMTIGRAVRLVATLTGHGAPGALDRATLGHSGKIGLCIAEHEEASPWPALAADRGVAAGVSAVTVFAGDAPLSVSDHRSRTPDGVSAAIGWAAATTWSPNWWPLDDVTSLVVIGLEHAALYAAHGWSKQRVREAIFEAPHRTAGELVAFGEAPAGAHAAPADTAFHKWVDPEQIQLVVAGGDAGRFSAVFGPAYGMGSQPVTRRIA